jgi:predicted membrane protein
MLGYTYTYTSFEEILSASGSILQLSFLQVILIAFLLGAIIFCIFVLVPLIYISLKIRKERREKKKKKQILTQFLLQKEIEDEVEKEIKIEKESDII